MLIIINYLYPDAPDEDLPPARAHPRGEGGSVQQGFSNCPGCLNSDPASNSGIVTSMMSRKENSFYVFVTVNVIVGV